MDMYSRHLQGQGTKGGGGGGRGVPFRVCFYSLIPAEQKDHTKQERNADWELKVSNRLRFQAGHKKYAHCRSLFVVLIHRRAVAKIMNS